MAACNETSNKSLQMIVDKRFNDGTSNIFSLPEELMNQIFSLLSTNDQLFIRQTCQSWDNLISSYPSFLNRVQFTIHRDPSMNIMENAPGWMNLRILRPAPIRSGELFQLLSYNSNMRGKHIRSLEFGLMELSPTEFYLLIGSCPNLHQLSLKYLAITPLALDTSSPAISLKRNVEEICEKLTHIKIISIHLGTTEFLYENVIMHSKQLMELKVHDLSYVLPPHDTIPQERPQIYNRRLQEIQRLLRENQRTFRILNICFARVEVMLKFYRIVLASLENVIQLNKLYLYLFPKWTARPNSSNVDGDGNGIGAADNDGDNNFNHEFDRLGLVFSSDDTFFWNILDNFNGGIFGPNDPDTSPNATSIFRIWTSFITNQRNLEYLRFPQIDLAFEPFTHEHMQAYTELIESIPKTVRHLTTVLESVIMSLPPARQDEEEDPDEEGEAEQEQENEEEDPEEEEEEEAEQEQETEEDEDEEDGDGDDEEADEEMIQDEDVLHQEDVEPDEPSANPETNETIFKLPDQFKHLEDLESFSFTFNINRIPDDFYEMTISNNQPPLYKKLKKLKMGPIYSHVSQVRALPLYRNLIKLLLPKTLTHLTITGQLRHGYNDAVQIIIQHLDSLQSLQIRFEGHENEKLTDYAVTGISKTWLTENVKRIHEFKNFVHDECQQPEFIGSSLSRLKHLRILNLNGLTKLTDFGIYYGLKLPNLQKLILSTREPYNKISDWGLAQLGQNSPRLEVIHMSLGFLTTLSGIQDFVDKCLRLKLPFCRITRDVTTQYAPDRKYITERSHGVVQTWSWILGLTAINAEAEAMDAEFAAQMAQEEE